MKPLERIALLCALVALAYACSSDNSPVGPGAAKRLAADVSQADQPAYGPWGAPANLGPVVNSASNDQHPSISKDGLSLYFVSNRLGGFGGNDIWVTQRASVDDAWGPPQNLGPAINTSSSDFAPNLTIDGHHYIDGGMRSLTNADLAKGYGVVIVVDFNDPSRRSEIGKSFGALADRELKILRDSSSTVEYVAPDAATLAAFGPNRQDPTRRKAAFAAGIKQGHNEAQKLNSIWKN